MNRLYLGIVLLLVLLILGTLTASALEKAHLPICQDLEQAALAAEAGNWEKNTALSDLARAEWVRNRPLTASLLNQKELEAMDSLFQQLIFYRDRQDRQGCALICTQLAVQLRQLGSSHRFSLWNFL